MIPYNFLITIFRLSVYYINQYCLESNVPVWKDKGDGWLSEALSVAQRAMCPSEKTSGWVASQGPVYGPERNVPVWKVKWMGGYSQGPVCSPERNVPIWKWMGGYSQGPD